MVGDAWPGSMIFITAQVDCGVSRCKVRPASRHTHIIAQRTCSAQLLWAGSSSERSAQGASRKLLCASHFAQVSLRKCLRASALQKLLCESLHVTLWSSPCKCLCASCDSWRECTSCTTCALKRCDFLVGIAGMRFAYYFCT